MSEQPSMNDLLRSAAGYSDKPADSGELTEQPSTSGAGDAGSAGTPVPRDPGDVMNAALRKAAGYGG